MTGELARAKKTIGKERTRDYWCAWSGCDRYRRRTPVLVTQSGAPARNDTPRCYSCDSKLVTDIHG